METFFAVFAVTAIFLIPVTVHSLPKEILPKEIDNKSDGQKAEAFLSKRNLLNFHNMISCGTTRKSYHYLGYGCWCGYGGQGQPVDPIDRCCFLHDMCYNDLTCSKKCRWNFMIYVVNYFTHSCTTCYGASSYSWWWWLKECREELCKCDAEAVKCFARNDHHYNIAYKNIDKQLQCKEHEKPAEYRPKC